MEVLKEPGACGWGLKDTGAPSAPSQAAVEITGVGSNRQHSGPEGQAGVATSQLTQRTRVQVPKLRDQGGQALGSQPCSKGWVRLPAWRECLVCPNIHLKGRTLHGGTVTFTEPVFQVLGLD